MNSLSNVLQLSIFKSISTIIFSKHLHLVYSYNNSSSHVNYEKTNTNLVAGLKTQTIGVLYRRTLVSLKYGCGLILDEKMYSGLILKIGHQPFVYEHRRGKVSGKHHPSFPPLYHNADRPTKYQTRLSILTKYNWEKERERQADRQTDYDITYYCYKKVS